MSSRDQPTTTRFGKRDTKDATLVHFANSSPRHSLDNPNSSESSTRDNHDHQDDAPDFTFLFRRPLRGLRQLISSPTSAPKRSLPADEGLQGTDVSSSTGSQSLDSRLTFVAPLEHPSLASSLLSTHSTSASSIPSSFNDPTFSATFTVTLISDKIPISSFTPSSSVSPPRITLASPMDSIILESTLSSTPTSIDAASSLDPSETPNPSSTMSDFEPQESATVFPSSEESTGFPTESATETPSDSSSSSPIETPSSPSETEPTSDSIPDPTPQPSAEPSSTSETIQEDSSVFIPAPSTTTPPASEPLPPPITTSGVPEETSQIPIPLPITYSSSTRRSSRSRSITTLAAPRSTTLTITRVYTTTYSGSVANTITTVIETGILRTDAPSATGGLSNDVSAIVGITIGTTFAAIVAFILLFFFCRKYRRIGRSSDNEALADGQPSWQPPFRGEFDQGNGAGRGFLHGAVAVASRLGRKFSNRSGPSDDGTYVEEKAAGSGSADTLSLGTGDPRQTIEQSTGQATSSDDNHNLPSYTSPSAQGPADGTAFAALYGALGSRQHAPATGTSADDIRVSAIDGATVRKRVSLPGPRPRPISQLSKRNVSTPGSFPLPVIDQHDEDEGKDDNRKGSLRGLLGRLGARIRKGSAGSSKTIQPYNSTENGNPISFNSSESLVDTPVIVPSPALVNDGKNPHYSSIMYPSTAFMSASLSSTSSVAPLLSFPRGVTGCSHVQRAGYANQPILEPPPSLHPAFTLPSPPSPTDDSASGVVQEGLLHPRLSMMQPEEMKASCLSFDDHQDYSRPIGAAVIRHQLSLATLERANSFSSAGSLYMITEGGDR